MIIQSLMRMDLAFEEEMQVQQVLYEYASPPILVSPAMQLV